MPRSSHQALINRGRKAGLNTSEIYRALESRPPQAHEVNRGGCDGNGFTIEYDSYGHTTYRSESVADRS